MSSANVLPDNAVHDTAGRAAATAGWDGVVLPPLRLSGFAVHPVVAIDREVCEERLNAQQYPETDMSTLAMWEGWSADPGPAPPNSPLSITGFISTASPRRALYGLDVLSGYGAGLILFESRRRPSEWTMRECDLAGAFMVWSSADGCECVVTGRYGPVATARRTVATRQKEEILFAHALRSGQMRSGRGALRS